MCSASASAMIGLARITAVDDPKGAHERADQAVELGEGIRKVPALLTRGWVELMSGDRQRALADASRATVAARQRRDNPGLAEAITLSVLAARDPAANAARSKSPSASGTRWAAVPRRLRPESWPPASARPYRTLTPTSRTRYFGATASMSSRGASPDRRVCSSGPHPRCSSRRWAFSG